MLKLSIIFFIISIIAAFFGYGGAASATANIGMFLFAFWLFLAVAVVSLVFGLLGMAKPKA